MSAGQPCRRCATPLEAGDLRCAVCGCASPETGAALAQAVARILRCTECGAAVSSVAEAQAPQCAFCRAVMRLEEPVDPIEQAEGYVPFTVPHEHALEAVKRWMSSLGFFRPADLAASSTMEHMHPLWWAAWMIHADALVSWTADSNAGSGRSDWAPHACQTSLAFRSLVVPASRGLSYEECIRLTPHFSMGYELLLERLHTTRIALPTYVFAYRYRDKVYRVVVHGQDMRCVFGTSPIAWSRVAVVVLLVVAVVILIVVIFTIGR